MRLAGDDLTLKLDGSELVTLRPTLRAALRLERRHGGFDRIVSGIQEQSITIISDVIRETATTLFNTDAYFSTGTTTSLRVRTDAAALVALLIVLALAGIDPDAENTQSEKTDAAKAVTFADHHAHLFRIGTGWLGWSPADTWSATPAEIIAAYEGRVELLKAVFGGSDQDAGKGSELSLDEKLRAGFSALGTVKVKRPKKEADHAPAA